jgi:quercetin dioxygenase-like cupin family protein
VESILDQLDSEVAWEQGIRDTGMPYLKPGFGRAHTASFFEHLMSNLQLTHFEPGEMCEGGDAVIVPVWQAGRIIGGGEIPMNLEAHEWRFGPDGKVVSFRHIADWALHEHAAAERNRRHTGRTLNVVGDHVEVLSAGGPYEVFRVSGPADSGPPPHAHPWDESFLALSGEVEVMITDEMVRLSPGSFVSVRAGTLHSYRIASSEATFVAITSGHRASTFFDDVDAHVPQGPPSAETLPMLIEVARRNSLTSPLFD